MMIVDGRIVRPTATCKETPMADEPILIRAMEPHDLPGVTAIYNQPHAVWGTLQVPFTSVETRQGRHQTVGAGHTLLVAELDGVVVGHAGLHTIENRRRAHVATLGMAVHDAYVGRGIGGALLDALVTQADKWLAVRRIELTVWADNERAIALYERFGFEREGLLRAYAFREGAYVDAVTMARLRL